MYISYIFATDVRYDESESVLEVARPLLVDVPRQVLAHVRLLLLELGGAGSALSASGMCEAIAMSYTQYDEDGTGTVG